MHKNGFVYNYESYKKDESKEMDFSPAHLNRAINSIISNEDRDVRQYEIESYLGTLENNNAANFVNIYHHFMDAIQQIYSTLMPKHNNAFIDINMSMSTAESYSDIVRILGLAVDITHAAYEKMHAKESAGYGEIVRFIETNIANTQLSPNLIAEYFGMSQRKLSSDFKQEYGHSLSDEITIKRLETVADYLCTTEEPIKTIMEKCGFISESNFYRMFKKYYKRTPAEYKSIQSRGYKGEEKI